jgi:hypothetical protein
MTRTMSSRAFAWTARALTAMGGGVRSTGFSIHRCRQEGTEHR